jgi:hypothetical protein
LLTTRSGISRAINCSRALGSVGAASGAGFAVEGTGLVEDRRWDRRLADVMQPRGQTNPLRLVVGLAEL